MALPLYPSGLTNEQVLDIFDEIYGKPYRYTGCDGEPLSMS